MNQEDLIKAEELSWERANRALDEEKDERACLRAAQRARTPHAAHEPHEVSNTTKYEDS